jgi:hypothetical protein
MGRFVASTISRPTLTREQLDSLNGLNDWNAYYLTSFDR